MAKILTITILLLAFNSVAISQTDERLYPVTDNAKFGFANADGKVIIEPQFERASGFHNGLAMVEIGRKRGFVDTSGKFVVQPKYDEAGDFSEGLAVVSRSYRWGFIDTLGNEVIPLQFIEAFSFSDGLAAVYVQSFDPKEDSKWGYINTKGEMVINPAFHKAFDFRNGVAKVIVGKFGENIKQGFIDKIGKFVIRPTFELAGSYSEGLIPVEIGGKSKKIGERVYSHISGKWAYINAAGDVVIKARFENADGFSEGLANVKIGDKYGYIDRSGKIVIKPQFEFSSNAYRCAHFVEGRACFERNGKIGFIDTTGKVVIEPQFAFARAFSGGLAQVNFGVYPGTENEQFPIRDNYGLIDRIGRIVYKPKNKARPSPPDVPGDPSQYEFWRKIEEASFSFYVPNGVEGGPKQGIDTAIYRYEGAGLIISFDIGMIANPRPRSEPHKTISIDGQNCAIWFGENRVLFNCALGPNLSKINFNMYISSSDTDLRAIAEKMISSIRFK